ncbi:hypothetical protein [Pseudidiomarina insulisalsae]|uniref:Polysaccharide biosynthesis protein n=1 Tax=Pseudidiomarina insulisalsae TaxID=575789 RepID=A0A432YNQ7_9GAMM|nr:hypothetical protein [Pseudidiomarina insulisalsae]RUO62639.1 hypothetical protein CWI71_04195 [Pseudidiomarina insulisalsae]
MPLRISKRSEYRGLTLSFIIYALASFSLVIFDFIAIDSFEKSSLNEIIKQRSIVLLTFPLLLLGSDYTIVKFGKISTFQKRWITLLIILFLIFVVFAISTSYDFDKINYSLIFLSVVVYAFCVLGSSIYRRESKFLKAQILLNGWKILLLILGLTFIISDSQILSAYIIPTTFLGLILLLILSPRVFLLFFEENKADINEQAITNYGLLMMLSSFILVAGQFGDQFFSTIALSDQSLRKYLLIINTFVFPVVFFGTFMGFILLPKWVNMSESQVRKDFNKILFLFTFVSALFCLISYYIANYLAPLFFDSPIPPITPFETLVIYIIALMRSFYSVFSTYFGARFGNKSLGYLVISNLIFIILFSSVLLISFPVLFDAQNEDRNLLLFLCVIAFFWVSRIALSMFFYRMSGFGRACFR